MMTLPSEELSPVFYYAAMLILAVLGFAGLLTTIERVGLNKVAKVTAALAVYVAVFATGYWVATGDTMVFVWVARPVTGLFDVVRGLLALLLS